MIESTIVAAVLSPLVSKLTEDFLRRRRNAVKITELQHQVVDLLASQRRLEVEAAQARLTVLALTRYLALSQHDIFVVHEDLLELAIAPGGENTAVIGGAIDRFNSSVEAHVARRHRLAVESPPQSPERSARRQAEADSLNRFFDGFEEEIMQARLGRGGSNE